MIAHCELMGDRVAILDPPPGLNAQQIKDWRVNEAGYDSKFATALLAVAQGLRPRHAAPTSSSRRAATWPASGPATTTPAACTRRRPTRSSAARSACRRRSPRPSTTCSTRSASTASARFPGRGIRVWGARTLSSDPAWRYLNVRRLFNYLEESILLGTQWVVFEPNDHALWARIRRTISAFLVNEWRKGALFGTHPRRGVLRQVRRRDQPGRGHRRRPGRLPDRRRAGQAGRVRHLPAVPVLRRHQPRQRVIPVTRKEHDPWHSPTRSTHPPPTASRSPSTASRSPRSSRSAASRPRSTRSSMKQQTKDGKYVVRQLIGRAKPGEFTVTRGLTDSKTDHRLAQDGHGGRRRRRAQDRRRRARSTTRARRSRPTTSSTAGCSSVEVSSLKAGAAEQATEKFTVCFDEVDGRADATLAHQRLAGRPR